MGRRSAPLAVCGPNGDEIQMLVDQLGNQPGQVLGRQPVIQRRRRQPLIQVEHANILSATPLRPPEMRVSALSKSYFGQSAITELISHPSSRASCP
jgi:hypothetical protein